MSTITCLEAIHVSSLFPSAAAPVYDPCCEEWVLTDSDGIHYCGNTPSECYRQFVEALHTLSDHLRKNGRDPAEFPPYRSRGR